MFNSKFRNDIVTSFGNQARDNILKYLIDNETGNYLTLSKNEENETVITLYSKDGNELSDIKFKLITDDEIEKIQSIDFSIDTYKLTLHTDKQDYECDLSIIKDELDYLKEDVQFIDNRMDALEDSFEVLSTREDATSQLAHDLETSVQNLAQGQSEVISELEEFEGTVTQSFVEVNDKISAIDDAIDNIEDDISTIQGNINTIESNIDSIENNIDSIENNIDSIETNIDDIENNVDSIEEDISGIHQNISDINQDIVDINSAIVSLDQDLTQAISTEAQERINADNTLSTTKQDNLVSGSNIKSINDESIVGSGNLYIPIGSIYKTGAELEDMTYEAGQQYYCTQSSEIFTAGNTYLGLGGNSIVKYNSTAIENNPAITAFSISPTSTELGDKKTVSYSYTLKKYREVHNLKLDGTLIVAQPSSSSGSGTISDQNFDSHTFVLSADGINSKSATISPLYRQFYGVVQGNTISEVLANLKNVTTSTDNITTLLQNSLPARVSFYAGLSSTPNYAYLVVRSNLTITSIKSAGFDVPFSLVDTTTFTNSYNSTYEVKVYRTDNKIFGDVLFTIN